MLVELIGRAAKVADAQDHDDVTRAERPQEPPPVDKGREQTKAPPADKPSGSLMDRMRQHPIAIGISFGLIVIGVVGGIL